MADLDNNGRLDLIFGGMSESSLLNHEDGWEAVDFPSVQWEDETGLGHIKSAQPMDIEEQSDILDSNAMMLMRRLTLEL